MTTGFLMMPSGDKLQVEIARTPGEKRTGYMFRDRIPPDSGMLFVHRHPGFYPIWMANTAVPLDVVWLDNGGRVVEVYPNAEPYSLRRRGGNVESSLVLEMGAGGIERYGLQVGASLPRFVVPSFPAPALAVAAVAAFGLAALLR